MSKLLPCPFCASRAPYIEEDDRCGIFIICSDCGARSGLEFLGDIVGDHRTRNAAIAAAIAAWNKRAEDVGLKKRLREFAEKQKQLDPEFVKLVNENFWDLLA